MELFAFSIALAKSIYYNYHIYSLHVMCGIILDL